MRLSHHCEAVVCSESRHRNWPLMVDCTRGGGLAKWRSDAGLVTDFDTVLLNQLVSAVLYVACCAGTSTNTANILKKRSLKISPSFLNPLNSKFLASPTAAARQQLVCTQWITPPAASDYVPPVGVKRWQMKELFSHFQREQDFPAASLPRTSSLGTLKWICAGINGRMHPTIIITISIEAVFQRRNLFYYKYMFICHFCIFCIRVWLNLFHNVQ